MWTIIATDGIAVGNLDFLRDYRKRDQEEYISGDGNPRILSIKQDSEDSQFDIYTFEIFTGKAAFHINKQLKSTIHRILHIPETETLEGRTVRAYYQGNRLVGFTKP